MLTLLLPHRDFTTQATAAAPGEVLDLGRQFMERVESPDFLRPHLGALRDAPRDTSTLTQLLCAEAGASVLRRPGGNRAARLFGQGALLRSLQPATAPVQLRLDDLELSDGRSTERSDDIFSAVASSPLPFEPELRSCAEACRGAPEVRVWLERDQQLPALARLLQLVEHPALALDGPFAQTHAQALARWRGVRAITASAPLRFDVTGADLGWGPRADAPFGAEVTLAALAKPGTLLGAGCRLAVVGFCALDEEVLGADGTRMPRAALDEAVSRLSEGGTAVWGEWWVGAPGVDARAHERTLSALLSACPFPHWAGVRPFHWSVQRTASHFGGAPVALFAPEAGRDLARSRGFLAPGSVEAAARLELIEHLARALRGRFGGIAGRLAGAFLSASSSPGATADAAGPQVTLAAEAAVVPLPASLEGAPRPSWYAVQLATGTTLALDPRIAPLLVALETPSPSPLSGLPEAARAKLLSTLLEKQILAKVSA